MIDKITVDFEKIVALTKLKKIKNFIAKNEKRTIKDKTNNNWKII